MTTPSEVAKQALREATGFEPHAPTQGSQSWAVLWRDQFAEPLVVELELTGIGGALLVYRHVGGGIYRQSDTRKNSVRLVPSDANVPRLVALIRNMLGANTNFTGPRTA